MLDQSTYADALTAASAILLPYNRRQDARDLVHEAICRMLRKVRRGWSPASPADEIRYLRVAMKYIAHDWKHREIPMLSIDGGERA